MIARDSTTNLLGLLDARTMVIEPDGVADRLPEAPGIEASWRDDGALAVSYRSRATTADAVLEAVRAADIRIRDVRTEQSDLEDVFLALTGSS